jgi:hypothetical protein
MFIDMEHLRENRYEIRFLFEIPEYVAAKCPVVRGKRSAVALQKAQNRTGLTLGQHPNRGKRIELNAGGGNEFIGGFEVFRFMHGLVVSDFNSYPDPLLGCLPKGGQQRLDEYAVTFCRSFAGARWAMRMPLPKKPASPSIALLLSTVL